MQVKRLGRIAGLSLVALCTSAYKVEQTSGTISVVSLTDYDKCARDFEGSEACLDALKAYIDKQPKDAFAAGKRARLNYQHWVALGFFAKAFNKATPAEQCSDDDVAMAVTSGMALPDDHPQLEVARKVAERCWEQLQPKLVRDLQGDTSYYRAHACKLFAEKKITPVECQPPKPEPKRPPAPTAVELLKGVSANQVATDPESARVFRGQRGEELLLLRSKPGARDVVLLKFKGIVGPWNNHVLVAIERPGGRGKDYVTVADQREWTVVTERGGQFDAYPKGVRETLSLYEVALERGLKERPTPGDVASEFGTTKPTVKR